MCSNLRHSSVAYQDRLEERKPLIEFKSELHCYLFASKILDLSLGFSPNYLIVFLPGSSNHLRLRWWLRISCTKLIVFDVAIGFFNEKESLCTASSKILDLSLGFSPNYLIVFFARIFEPSATPLVAQNFMHKVDCF